MSSVRSPVPRLTDIIQACERLRARLQDIPLPAFEADWLNQWIVERGVEIISEASRHLPDDMKARHTNIPWPKVAGIGNLLRHNYERVSPSILWTLVHTELPVLEQVCRDELAKEQSKP